MSILFVDSVQTLGDRFLNDTKPVLDLAEKRVYTYDMADAHKYGWHHTYCYYSALPMKHKQLDCDVFLVMYNKGRAEKAIEYYDLFASRGIKCLFYIHGVDQQFAQMNKRAGVIYNHPLQYPEVIGLLSGCRVILELCQAGQKANALRAFEAVVYSKRLLTDNDNIKSFPFYCPDQMKCFSTTEDIDTIDNEFFQSDKTVLVQHYHSEFSPRNLIDVIRSSYNCS